MLALNHIRKMTERIEILMDNVSNRYGAGNEMTLELTSLWVMSNIVLDEIERLVGDGVEGDYETV